MYNRLGRAAIRFSLTYLRRRHRRQLRIAAALAAAALATAAYLAARDVPEG